jgi:hypothetical protein
MREHQTDGKANDGCRGDPPVIPIQNIANDSDGRGHFLHLNKSSGNDNNCPEKSQLAEVVKGVKPEWRLVRFLNVFSGIDSP